MLSIQIRFLHNDDEVDVVIKLVAAVEHSDLHQLGVLRDLVLGDDRDVREDLREILVGASGRHANGLSDFSFLEMILNSTTQQIDFGKSSHDIIDVRRIFRDHVLHEKRHNRRRVNPAQMLIQTVVVERDQPVQLLVELIALLRVRDPQIFAVEESAGVTARRVQH